MEPAPRRISQPNVSRSLGVNPRAKSYNSAASSHQEQFINQIETFLETELANAKSDSDKIHVYQRAFESLANEFQSCRPLLERIQQQYDLMASALLAKKREIVAESTSMNDAEDSFSEMVNRMRKVRNQEFAHSRAESERLLDEMTELRVQRSDLLNQLDQLQKRKIELVNAEAISIEEMNVITAKVHDLMYDIKQSEAQTADAQKKINEIKDITAKTEASTQELSLTDCELQKQRIQLEEEERQIKDELDQLTNHSETLTDQIIELQKKLKGLENEKKDAQEKLEGIHHRKDYNLTRLYELLKNTDIDPDQPIEDILNQILCT